MAAAVSSDSFSYWAPIALNATRSLSSYIEKVTYNALDLLDAFFIPCRTIIFSVCHFLFCTIVDGVMFVVLR